MQDRPPSQEFAASTAVVVRDGAEGLEVLMLQRSDHGQFANMWVFPGGRVDDADLGDDEISRARAAAARETLEEVHLELDPSVMIPWSHWSPPAAMPKRFLTWFFVSLWHGDEPVVDGHEIVGYQWAPAAFAAEMLRPIAPPTFVTLHQLSAFSEWAAIEAAHDHVVEHFLTRVSDIGPRLLLWSDDSNYDTGDSAEGNHLHRLLTPDDGPMRYLRGPKAQ